MTNTLISAHQINKTFTSDGLHVEALKDVDLHLPVGCLAVVCGPSSGGKSTLLHILGGIDRVDSETLEVAGIRLDQANNREMDQFRRDKSTFVFQFYNLLPSFNNVCLRLLARGIQKKQANLLAEDVLSVVGLRDRMRHHPAQLSGGERQRVAIARALIVRPSLILADFFLDSMDVFLIIRIDRAEHGHIVIQAVF